MEGDDHVGVAIGAHVLDLTLLEAEGLLSDLGLGAAGLQRGPAQRLPRARPLPLWSGAAGPGQPPAQPPARPSRRRRRRPWRGRILLPQTAVAADAAAGGGGDYTDFYSSREHATNVGTMLRGADKALMPNWLHLPVAYHGRASSLVVGGTPVRRPHGQSKPDKADAPVFGPSRSLDFELECGGPGRPGQRAGPGRSGVAEAEGQAVRAGAAQRLVARDLQAWEYMPLGPFLAKNFATSVSPWVVPLEALEPFRTAGPRQDPTPLPYLHQDPSASTFDLTLEVWLKTGRMTAGQRVCRSNFRSLYWSLAQQVAHHTVNGCPLRPGDLLASGTVSGPTPDARLGWPARAPDLGSGISAAALRDGETRTSLQDGDTVTLTGWCQGDGYRVGFGELRTVVAAG